MSILPVSVVLAIAAKQDHSAGSGSVNLTPTTLAA